MAGSLRLVKKPNVWELRVYLGRDASGRVRHKHRTFRGSKRAAEVELARLVLEQVDAPAASTTGPVLWGPDTTVNDAIRAWQANGWEDLSPKTTMGYESTWHRHIEATIGRERIARLGTYDVERYFRRLKADGTGRSTLLQIRAILHRSCRLARKWSGGTLPNPVADAELPTWTLAERRVPVRAPELDEVRRLLKAADNEDPRLAALLRVVAATGLRRGEACALRWSDLDLETGIVVVDESVVAAKGAVVKGPKTRASVRRLTIDAGTAATLDALRRLQEHLAQTCRLPLRDEGFVFSFAAGGSEPPHPDAVSHAFTRIRARAGVAADVHLHSLRHFQATALDPVVSERQKQARMGWSTVHMARHYTDAIDHEDRRAAEHVGRLLGGDDTPAGNGDADPTDDDRPPSSSSSTAQRGTSRRRPTTTTGNGTAPASTAR